MTGQDKGKFRQPLVLYYATTGTIRAAALPPDVSENSDSFLFEGVHFARTGDGLVFWDYLTLPGGEITGVVLNDFEVQTSLERSRLLTASSNVTRNDYGYYVRLVSSDVEPEVDGSQAFGCSLFEHNAECLLLLTDWHQRGYVFSLDYGLITPP